MSGPGERRLPGTPSDATAGERGWGATGRTRRASGPRRSQASGLLLAALIAIGAAAAWAVLRGVLDLGPTALAVAAVGGWGIGAVLRDAHAPAIVAPFMGAAAWGLGLILSWLLAMILLPASSRTLTERLVGTPFLDWLAPQFGVLEIAGLLVFVVVAAWTARPAAGRGS